MCHQNDCLLKHSGHTLYKPDVNCCIEDGFVYKTQRSHPGTVDILHNNAHLYPEIVEFLYL